jgi:hypothetical protein
VGAVAAPLTVVVDASRQTGCRAVGIGATLFTFVIHTNGAASVADTMRIVLTLDAHHRRHVAGAPIVGRSRAVGVGRAAELAGVVEVADDAAIGRRAVAVVQT